MKIMVYKIVLEIKDCSGCPHCDISRIYTPDSFKMIVKWICRKSNKVISDYVEHRDKLKIPDWCKILIKE